MRSDFRRFRHPLFLWRPEKKNEVHWAFTSTLDSVIPLSCHINFIRFGGSWETWSLRKKEKESLHKEIMQTLLLLRKSSRWLEGFPLVRCSVYGRGETKVDISSPGKGVRPSEYLSFLFQNKTIAAGPQIIFRLPRLWAHYKPWLAREVRRSGRSSCRLRWCTRSTATHIA